MKQKEEVIEIQVIRKRNFLFTIEGLSPLICHRRSPENIRPNPEHEHNDEEDFKNSLYPKVGGKHSFIASGLKKCAVGAAGRFLRSVKSGTAKGSFFIPVEYVPIEGDEPVMRRDVVTIKKDAIVRARAQFNNWKIVFPVEFSVVGNTSVEQIVNLFNVAGNCVGLGDWRPDKGGIFGRFKVVEVKELK